MDSITQIALGAAVAERIAGRKIGNKSFLYGAILGTIPDLDIFVGKLMDPIDAIEIHRGFSHSIVFFLLLSPILSFLIYKIERRNLLPYKTALHLVFWCLFTHVLLDAFTSWGTQIFWPLDLRIDFKSIFVIDPLYTIPLLVCIFISSRFPKFAPSRLTWINRGLIISTAYLFLTVGMKGWMFFQFKKALDQNEIQYESLMVKPSPLNIILWNANVQTENGYYLGDHSLLDRNPIQFRYIEKNNILLAPIIRQPKVQQLIKISEGWYTVDTIDNKWIINDLRFGLLHPYSNSEENSFVFSYELWKENGMIKAQEVRNKNRDSGKILLQQLWSRIKGNS